MVHAVRSCLVVTLAAGLSGAAGLTGCDGVEGDSAAARSQAPKQAREKASAGTGKGSAPKSSSPEGGQKPGAKPDPPFDPPDPDDPIAQRVHEIAGDRFAQQMLRASPMHRGSLDEGGVRNYQAVLKPLRCYRVIAVGGDGVEDLDLMLFDRGGIPVQTETGTDATPVLGLQEPLCPQQAGVFRLQVKMFKGAGEYGVRIFRTHTKMEQQNENDDG